MEKNYNYYLSEENNNKMIVCSIPIKIFDIHRDGKVINPQQTNKLLNLKMQQKKTIRNTNFLKMAMHQK